MLCGKELILATKPFAKEDRRKSWLYMLSTLALLCCAIAGCYTASYIWLKLVCSIFSGLLMVRLFVIYHDHQHHAILHRSLAADTIMTIYGMYVLAPTSIWKRSHDHHHSHNSKLFTASIGSYPIVTKKQFLAMNKKQQAAYLFTRHPLTILFGYFFMFMIGMCLRSFMSNPRKHGDSLMAIIIHVTGSILVFCLAGWQAWLFGIFIPFFIATCIGAYLFYAQHNFPGVRFACNKEWKYERAALESSSYLCTNPFMQWMTANIGYHHIHHLNSRIPFYRLPETMAAIPELQVAHKTSFSINDIAACFRLKVWDPERGEMIGLKDVYVPADEPVTNEALLDPEPVTING